jgi:hypothetical protein
MINEIDLKCFWGEFTCFIEEHKSVILADKNQPSTSELPLSYSTYYKWTNGYVKNFPHNEIFTLVMKKVSKSNKAVDWLHCVSEDKSKLKKYILNKFVTLSEYEVFESQKLDNVTIYESYLISICGINKGVLEKNAIKNIAILKYALTEDDLSGISKRITPQDRYPSFPFVPSER